MSRLGSGAANALGRPASVAVDLGRDLDSHPLRVAHFVRVQRVLTDPRAEDPPRRALGEAVLEAVGAVRDECYPPRVGWLRRGVAAKGVAALRRFGPRALAGVCLARAFTVVDRALYPNTAEEQRHPRAADAVAAFYSEGWRERLAGSLRTEFDGSLGHDAILDAVDGALEAALTRLKPEPGSEPPMYSGRMLFALAKTIAWRRMRDQLRHNAKPAAPVTGIDPKVVAEIPDYVGRTPEEISLSNERAEQIREAAAGLDEETLQVLSLFHVEGFRKPQIQRLLGLSEHAVRTCLRRGNEYLLEKYLEVDAGKTCAGGRVGLVRLAFDLARGREARRVRAHIGHCRECARHYQRALSYRRAVSGVTPVPIVWGNQCPGGGLEGGLRAGRESLRRLRDMFADRIVGRYTVAAARRASAAGYGGKFAGVCALAMGLTAGGVYGIVSDSRGDRATGIRVSPATQSLRAVEAAAVPLLRKDHARLSRVAKRRVAATRKRRSSVRTTDASHRAPVGASQQPETQPHATPPSQPEAVPLAGSPSADPASAPPAAPQPAEFPAP